MITQDLGDDSPEKPVESSRAINEVEAVRERLEQWRDYREGRSSSMPGPAYFTSDLVADAIYKARKPILSNYDPKLDLRVSDSAIQEALGRAKAGEKYIFL